MLHSFPFLFSARLFFLAPFFCSYISMLNFEIFLSFFYFLFSLFSFCVTNKNVWQKAAGEAGCDKTFSLCCIIYGLFFFSIIYDAKLFKFIIKVFFNTFICVICILNSNQFIAMFLGIVTFSFVVFFLFFELFFTSEIVYRFIMLNTVIFN